MSSQNPSTGLFALKEFKRKIKRLSESNGLTPELFDAALADYVARNKTNAMAARAFEEQQLQDTKYQAANESFRSIEDPSSQAMIRRGQVILSAAKERRYHVLDNDEVMMLSMYQHKLFGKVVDCFPPLTEAEKNVKNQAVTALFNFALGCSHGVHLSSMLEARKGIAQAKNHISARAV